MLSPRQQSTLVALCRRMVPLPDDPDPSAARLARAVEVRLGSLDPEAARRIGGLLRMMDSPVSGLLNALRLQGFADLPADRQDAWLRRWEISPLPVFRTAFQGLRRLILSTHYADPSTFAGIGYRGPLHTRAPALPWEGPLPGRASDDEPVARQEPGARAARIIPIRPQLDLLADPAVAGVFEGAGLRAETRVRAGVCVVGSGAGGAVVAARLAQAGHDVVLLEEGGFWRPEQFTERESEMMPRLYAEAGTRATDDVAHPLLQGRSVGGGTTVNWLVMFRTPDWVLDEWATEHGVTGMRPADLAPVFERVEDETHTRPVPDDAHNPSNRALLDGARALGWSAGPVRINAHNCVRSGFCGLGCRYGARRAAADVYVPAALAAGARLFSDVRVERVELAERGGGAPLKRVHAAVLDRETGAPRGRLTVEAPVVVLAAGAVGTPALLQRSGMGGGGVGRFLRLHPTTAVFGRYGQEMYGAGGVPLSTVCDEFLRGSDGYGFWIETPPFYPALSAAALPGFGTAHRDLMESLPHLSSMIVLLRDGADRAVSNGGVTVDRAGRVRIRYRVAPGDRAKLLRGMDAAARMHFAAGAEEVSTLHAHACRMRSPAELKAMALRPSGPNQLGVLSAHVNGTCRLGTDPETSGCTPDGERHGVPGLYVADGSLLPTAPGVNPQETIMALATVIAERIAARHPAGRAGSAGSTPSPGALAGAPGD
ncbi:FAD-dependent oxidoreductase [Longimicrobium sp.]|uniref:FAD-dependent oxidoreductase n=1 Tax=Longimicrobium sp. TaxID=2029185 RepID=UPI002E37DE02|nr:FAD-dependent oxidoreductase [Longimicrobium sp.]HEX6037351.1 FAD-dependent oxidoreductase [Longimicrobium sp.]